MHHHLVKLPFRHQQDTLAKLSDVNRTEDGTAVIVDETTDLLTRLQSPLLHSACSARETASGCNVLSEFLTNTDCRSDVWLPKARTTVIRCDQISVSRIKNMYCLVIFFFLIFVYFFVQLFEFSYCIIIKCIYLYTTCVLYTAFIHGKHCIQPYYT